MKWSRRPKFRQDCVWGRSSVMSRVMKSSSRFCTSARYKKKYNYATRFETTWHDMTWRDMTYIHRYIHGWLNLIFLANIFEKIWCDMTCIVSWRGEQWCERDEINHKETKRDLLQPNVEQASIVTWKPKLHRHIWQISRNVKIEWKACCNAIAI